MYEIRNFRETDLEKIKEINYMMYLCLRWNEIYHKEDTFVAVDEMDDVLGVVTLFYDGTWYYIDKNRTDIPLYRLQLDLFVREDSDEEDLVRDALMNKQKEHFEAIKKLYPGKNIAMRCWCEDKDIKAMQFYLEKGFSGHNLVWVLGFDLKKDIPSYEIPKGITISKHDFSGNGMEDYLKANEKGYGVQDARAEIEFRMKDKNTVVFTAKSSDEVVASTMVWQIGNGRSATENIFTIPSYRRQNIGKETVAYALRYLKENGEQLATLTCVGDNIPAISMYLSMGYELKYYLVEMHYN